ncbi:MAG: secretin N-terminal domain-containing protein [Planctomycetota bacterium]
MKRLIAKCEQFRWLILAACLLVIAGAAVAESEQASPQVGGAAVAESEEALPQKEVLTAVQLRMRKQITVDFRATPIEDVLRALADQADIDIVKSPEVTGDVTAKLTDVPLSEALDNILAAHGYGFIATENMIRVVPRKDIIEAKEKVVNKVYRITYADVKEIEKALNKFVSRQGTVSANPGTSNLIVSDVESKLEAMDAFIKEIDRETPQILVEVRIYDITSADRLDLGVQWQAGRRVSYEDGLASNIGGESGVAGVTGKINPHIGGAFSGTVNEAENFNSLLRFGILSSSLNIDALIRAEHQLVDAKLLANPRIMVLDNEEASFDVVREIPYQELTQTGGTGGGTIGTTQFKEVGVRLNVQPHLTKDNKIRLHIVPEFSVKVGEVTITNTLSGGSSSTSDQPIVDKRKADTITLVQSGQTVVIGGLKKQEVNKTTNKVPLLGDLPVVGGLFKFTGEENIVSELVVFITPYLMEDLALTPSEQIQLGGTEISSPTGPTLHEDPEEQK